ncbi:putative C6 transcription factor [Biscogniauxia marginata]|nr:putative C6 transcription factor [Biscogniauxia marginata]
MGGAMKKVKSSAGSVTHLQHQSPIKTSTVTTDLNLGYKIRVLLYDFRNVRTDHASQERISLTIDPLYISTPYFTQDEAALIKAAVVDTCTEINDDSYSRASDHKEKIIQVSQPQSVEDMLQANLANFLEKRRACGGSRPCGPHDMAPLYKSVFGVSRTELQGENFLRRLRKSGLQVNQKQKE